MVLSIHPFIHSSIYLSIHPFIHSSIYLSIHPSIHPYICLSIHPFIHSSIYLSIHPFIHSFIHISGYVSIKYYHNYSSSGVIIITLLWTLSKSTEHNYINLFILFVDKWIRRGRRRRVQWRPLSLSSPSSPLYHNVGTVYQFSWGRVSSWSILSLIEVY